MNKKLTMAKKTSPNPYHLFRKWYAEAKRCPEIKYADAMCLSTVDPHGDPDGRIVMLQDVDESGFLFFTDENSPKGVSFAARPKAAVTFYWGVLDRQVRARGAVEMLSGDESQTFFQRRPRRSQITAWASRQSEPLKNDAELKRQYQKFREKFKIVEQIPCPPNWKTYRLCPHSIEFWTAKASRLHKRRLYTLGGDGIWEVRLLYP